MSELEDRINAVLGDPKQMERLSALAAQLMGGGGENKTAASESAPLGLSPDMLSRLGSLLGGAGGDSDKAALLKAMGPYLSQARREKLERAMRFARMAKLAGTAMREMGGGGNV